MLLIGGGSCVGRLKIFIIEALNVSKFNILTYQQKILDKGQQKIIPKKDLQSTIELSRMFTKNLVGNYHFTVKGISL